MPRLKKDLLWNATDTNANATHNTATARTYTDKDEFFPILHTSRGLIFVYCRYKSTVAKLFTLQLSLS